jgi:Tol biopolymer transport system component
MSLRRGWAVLLPVLAGACAADDSTATGNGGRGIVAISVRLTGNSVDPDGFRWTLGAIASGVVTPGAAVTVADVAAGTHLVDLSEVAPHCQARPPQKAVQVTGGRTAAVEFGVECIGGFVYSEWYSPNHWQLFYLGEDGVARPLTQLVARNTARELSPDGARIVFETNVHGGLDLYSVRLDGTDLRRLTTHPENDFDPRWSPDGGSIVFTRRAGTTAPRSTLHVVRADGTGERQLLATSGIDFDAVWTKDGTAIVFSCDRFGGQYDLCIVQADGSGVRPVVTLRDAREARLSPDGLRVATQVFAPPWTTTYVLRLDGTDVVNLTPGMHSPYHDWSPDGAQLVLNTFLDRYRIHRVNRDGTQLTEIARDSVPLVTPRWAPDGSWIAFVREHPVDQQVWLIRPDGSEARRVTNSFSYKMNPMWNPKARPGATGAAR